MKQLIVLGAFCTVALLNVGEAQAQRRIERIFKQNQASAFQPWHGQHYYLPYGQPTALVVPQTAAAQQNYAWGVSQNTVTPIHHQYGAAAMPSAGGAFYGTPIWPSHTRQFGVYPVRAPW